MSPKPRWLGFRPEKERTARQEAPLSMKDHLHLHLGTGGWAPSGDPAMVREAAEASVVSSSPVGDGRV